MESADSGVSLSPITGNVPEGVSSCGIVVCGIAEGDETPFRFFGDRECIYSGKRESRSEMKEQKVGM